MTFSQPRSFEPSSISLTNPSEAQRAYQEIRKASEDICQPLAIEDMGIQSMNDVSPPKWHLAHTSWFFETFVLKKALAGYQAFHPQFNYLFNSYYQGMGEHHPRPQRGLISRPTFQEVLQYRNFVDEKMMTLLQEMKSWPDMSHIIEIGLHHEKQHQELLLTDIKHILYTNPLHPVYQKSDNFLPQTLPPLDWVEFTEGLIEIGYHGIGFSYDNEGPRHKRFLEAFQLSNRLITNGEYLEFVESDGYTNPLLWLSDGWDRVQKDQWLSPLYWEKRGGQWWHFTLSGMRLLCSEAPVSHLSYYEAEAYARWQQKRLPTEIEWEYAASFLPNLSGNFLDSHSLQPLPANPKQAKKLQQMFGDVWEWTQSPYSPYPRFQPTLGALGEYNGKFMCNQMVLRGGSCYTPAHHIRNTYRNFFPPHSRWQCSGFRLAEYL